MTQSSKPHNYISYDELLMNRHWQYPLTEADAINMARVWFRINKLVAQYPATLTAPIVSSGYRPGHYNTQAGGAKRSTHLTCEAVDIKDPGNGLDQWLDSNHAKLVECELWREAPDRSPGWCHLDIRPRKSRTFNP
jgi:hypothetical protein